MGDHRNTGDHNQSQHETGQHVHDWAAFDWVCGEITDALIQARQSLEGYVTNHKDNTRLCFCQNYVHQVRGALEMVEFYGSALLAEEIENLIQELLSNSLVGRNEVLEILMQALLQFPAYLERVQSVRMDLPVIILPLLNDLRSARGENLLSETALFAPDLSGITPPSSEEDMERMESASLIHLLKKMRQMYQFALVGFFNDPTDQSSQDYFSRVFERMGSLCKGFPVADIWSVAHALVKTVASGGVRSNPAVRNLLRQVDNVFASLVNGGPTAFNVPVAEDLLKNALFYITRSTSNDAVTRSIRQKYNLSSALIDDDTVHREREKLKGPDVETIGTVVAAVSCELISVKDALDRYVRDPENEQGTLQDQLPLLKQIADTLAALGLGIPRKEIQTQLDTLSDLVSGPRRNLDDSLLMDVASSLLSVEEALADVVDGQQFGYRSWAGESTELRSARRSAIQESCVELKRVKDAIIEYSKSNEVGDDLKAIPDTLVFTSQCLEMVGQTRASELFISICDYVRKTLIPSVHKSSWTGLELFAEVLVAAEYYLERAAGGIDDQNEPILDIAFKSLKQLQAESAPEDDSKETIGSLDPELIAVFTKEAISHLEVINSFIEQFNEEGEESQPITDELQRALHTLKGSAGMAGVIQITKMASAVELMIRNFSLQGIQADEVIVSLLTRMSLLVQESIEHLGYELDDSTEIDGAQELITDVEAANETYIALQAEPVSPEQERIQSIKSFLSEHVSLVLEAVPALKEWNKDPADELITGLQMGLMALVDHAREIELDVFADLAEQLVVAYQLMQRSSFRVSDSVAEELITAHDCLADMMNMLAGQQTPSVPEYILARLQALIEELSIEPGVDDIQEVTDVTIGDLAALAEAGRKSALDKSETKEDSSSPSDDDDDPELLAIFLDEAMDNLDAASSALYSWLDNHSELNILAELQRYLHTIKGGARMSGIEAVGNLAHELEDVYEALSLGRLMISGDVINLLLRGHDALEEMLSAIRSHRPSVPADALCREIRDVMGQASDETIAPVAKPEQTSALGGDHHGDHGDDNVVNFPEAISFGESVKDVANRIPAPAFALLQNVADPRIETSNRKMMRVPADLLDQLVNLAGETSISRSRVEQQVNDFSYTLKEMHTTINRLQEQLRRLDIETQAQILSRHEGDVASHPDFDPLEMDQYSELTQLSRSLVESATDLMDLKNALEDKNRDSETLLLQQSRVNAELQKGLMRTRMLPFNRMLPRLKRVVRKVSSELGKNVELKVVNGEGEMDRSVMERMIAPLEHMLRNAVDHGIESSSADRTARGKSETGEISLNLVRDGGEIILSLADDGRGLDLEAIRRKAEEKGLLENAAEVSDSEVSRMIFKPGFSTVSNVTQISGRGVGMDVVNNELKHLGGHIKIHTEEGQGTEFKIHLPLTLSANRALMVNVGDECFAVPLNLLEGIVRLSPFELEQHYQRDDQSLDYAGQKYQLRYLGELLYNRKAPLDGITHELPVLLIRTGDDCVAIHVDGILSSREVVVKNLGPQFADVSGVSGATILGDGQVVIILDLISLLRNHTDNTAAVISTPEEPEVEQENNLIMVVDDSVTVRKVTGRLLKRNGYRTLSARDGVEAMALLQDYRPAVILLDIEMPRMDGFEVTKAVRNNPELKDIPIIMISSRTGEKHRQRARDIGVNEYMGKPFQEALLLETIGGFSKRHD